MKKMLRFGFLIPLFALSLVLGGCSDGSDGRAGADGRDGIDGEDGQDATVLIPGSGVPASFDVMEHEPAQLLSASIENVVGVDGVFTVDFEVDGLPTNPVEVEFTIAKWSVADNSWVSMLQRNRTRANDVPVVRASNLRPDPIDLTGDTFTFILPDLSQGAHWTNDKPNEVDGFAALPVDYQEYVNTIVEKVDIASTWDPTATYRIGVTSRQSERFTAVAYVNGTGTPVTEIPQQVSAETLMSCLDCHGEANIEGQTQFNYHSNRRQDPQLCTSCHNNFTYEAWSSTLEVDGWQMVDMMTMTHTIHAGIPDVYVNSEWEKVRFPDWTFGRTSRPSNDDPYPMNPGMANCTACHKGDVTAWDVDVFGFNEEPPYPRAAESMCVSCHTGDKYGFDLAADHPSELPEGLTCTDCHGKTADEIHNVSFAREALELARSYTMEISSVENAVAGQQAVVTWRVAKDGVYQDLFTGADTYLEDAVRLGIGWGYGDDWTNDGSGVSNNGDAGRPFQTTANAGNTVPGADNTYAVTTFPILPIAAAADRNGFAVVERGPAGINVSSALKTFTLGTGAATLGDRREIVSTDSCLGCHSTVGRHGTYADAASGVTSCVTCHNAGSLSRDGSVSQGTVDMMFIMHAIHGVGEEREKFDRRRDHGYDYVTYPNTILDCAACHVGDSHKTVDTSKRLGVIVDGGKDLYDMQWKGVNSPMGSVCLSCHEDNAGTYKAHFMTQGANMTGLTDHESYAEGDITEQSCMICHKED